MRIWLLRWMAHDAGSALNTFVSEMSVLCTQVPWTGMNIKRYVMCERLVHIIDAIILLMVPPLTSAIGGDDNEKIQLKDGKQNPQSSHYSDVHPWKNVT